MHLLNEQNNDLPDTVGPLWTNGAAHKLRSSSSSTMPDAILDDISHRRYNPLRGSWVLVSPHRTKRPWQGQQEAASEDELPEYDQSVCGNTGMGETHGNGWAK